MKEQTSMLLALRLLVTGVGFIWATYGILILPIILHFRTSVSYVVYVLYLRRLALSKPFLHKQRAGWVLKMKISKQECLRNDREKGCIQ